MLTELDQAAVELVTEFGGVGTYTTYTSGGYNPATSRTVNTPFSQAVKMVLLDLTLQSNGLSLKYGTEIKAGDKEAYVLPPQRTGGTAVPITPGKDKVTFGGVEYTVVMFKEINPVGNYPYVWFLYLRR